MRGEKDRQHRSSNKGKDIELIRKLCRGGIFKEVVKKKVTFRSCETGVFLLMAFLDR